MSVIDTFLDGITMYRLVLYYLLLLIVVAVIYCCFGILSYHPLALIISAVFLTIVCWGTNKLFAIVFQAPTNVESVYISACILTLILTPIRSAHDLIFLFWAGVLAMASKYIFAWRKKHLFNPVAIAVTMTAVGLVGSASWWVGTLPLLPFVLLGVLIMRKLRSFDLGGYFLLSALATIVVLSIFKGSTLLTTMRQTLTASSLFFFAFVMLTEPLTMPATKQWQRLYAVLVGILFAPQFHLGTWYTTPEAALVLGNLFSYLVSPKDKIIAIMKEKLGIGTDLVEFLFTPEKHVVFAPGQYTEWTLPHKHPDARGNRRYFTLASSPTETTLRLGVRFYPQGSSFKKALLLLDQQTPLLAGSPRGDFTLPSDPTKKLVFIAGGIGITPFRSMLKYLIDTKQQRPIVLFYANKTVDEIVYTDVLTQAQQYLAIKTVYTLTDHKQVPRDWRGNVGRIDAAMIAREVPDYQQRIFYLSGPQRMVVVYEALLKRMGIAGSAIKKDFFPGYA